VGVRSRASALRGSLRESAPTGVGHRVRSRDRAARFAPASADCRRPVGSAGARARCAVRCGCQRRLASAL